MTAPTPKSASWEASSEARRLADATTTAPGDVEAAAARLQTALTADAPAAFQTAKKLLDEGLRQLSPDVVPSTWIE